MTLDITQVQFSSTIDTFKNESTSSGSISVPNQSYTANQYRSFSTTIDITRTDGITHLYQNFSFANTRYYLGSFVQVTVNANFIAQTRAYVTGSTLTVDLYVVSTAGTTQSVPAFTLGLEARRFITPFS